MSYDLTKLAEAIAAKKESNDQQAKLLAEAKELKIDVSKFENAIKKNIVTNEPSNEDAKPKLKDESKSITRDDFNSFKKDLSQEIINKVKKVNQTDAKVENPLEKPKPTTIYA